MGNDAAECIRKIWPKLKRIVANGTGMEAEEVTLPTDNKDYNWHDVPEADSTYTGTTTITGTKDGVPGTYTFTGWDASEDEDLTEDGIEGNVTYKGEWTFTADSNDIWFHAKGVPGSHVIVKCKGNDGELPDRLYEEAASLAAYYSKNSGNDKVEVDYTLRKNLKRTNGGVPGYVIYHTNYSVMAEPRAKI